MYGDHNITEIENFVKRIGPNLYRTKCDIIQLGLQEPETSFIYTESYKLAKDSKKPYFYYKYVKFYSNTINNIYMYNKFFLVFDLLIMFIQNLIYLL